MAAYDQRHQVVTTQFNIAQGISEKQYQRLAEELGVRRSALRSFFKILKQQRVPLEDLDHTLRQIAASYKDLHAKLQRFTSDDSAVTALKQRAHNALEAGKFARAEALLNEASAKDLEAAQQLQETAAARLRSAAASRAANGDLKRTQLAYAEAAAYYQQAVGLVESVPTARPELAEYLNAWGIVSHEAGDYTTAEPLYQRALALREQHFGPSHPNVAQCLNNLAALYMHQGRYAAAEPILQHALALCEQALGPQHLDVAQSLNNLAALYEHQGRYAEAEPLHQCALALLEQCLGPQHPHVAQSFNNLATFYRDHGRYAAAEPLYQRALAITDRVLGPEHPSVDVIRKNYAALLRAPDRHAEAERLEARAQTGQTSPLL
jgi:tetratricopeptide (TPR) repeat protein